MRDSFCPIDPSQISLFGSYNALESRYAQLVVNECKDKDYCKSKQEIELFIDKATLSIIYNKVDYIPEEYETIPVKRSLTTKEYKMTNSKKSFTLQEY